MRTSGQRLPRRATAGRNASLDAEYLRLCDDAIRAAKDLRARYEEAGDDEGAELARRAVEVLGNERAAAAEGRGARRSEGVGFAPTRFVSDYEWGDEGKRFVDAVYAMQDYWAAHT
jgi:hypothetical protein